MSSTSGTLEIHDTRTKRRYTIPVKDNVILGDDIAKITAAAGDKAENKGEQLRILDPGYANTAVMESDVTYW
jgi:citrate synthase